MPHTPTAELAQAVTAFSNPRRGLNWIVLRVHRTRECEVEGRSWPPTQLTAREVGERVDPVGSRSTAEPGMAAGVLEASECGRGR